MAKEYYSILGVSKSASEDEIKKAFRKLAHQHHPDKGGGNEAKFKELNEAYQVLGNREKRAKYDQFGEAAFRPGGGPGPSGFRWEDVASQGGFRTAADFGDLGDIFGDMFGFGGGRRRTGPHAGRDIEVEVPLTFLESAFGGTKTITLRHQTMCSRCNGNGAEPGVGTETCATCKGQGQVERLQQTILGAMRTATVCPACHGEGSVPKHKCKRCGGDGRTDETETLKVNIPAGIASGQRIRLAGKGEAGERGAAAGDLFVRVRVASDKRFERDGFDVISTVRVSMSTAALGGAVEVETIEGPVSVKIPAGTPSGRVIVLKHKGIAKLSGRGRGDHRVTVDVVIPTKLSSKAKKLLQELSEEGL